MRISFGLVVAISLLAVVVIMSRRSPAKPELKPPDYNPDKFYLQVSGKLVSYSFTYDPHEADAWMFRTAEGDLANSNHPPATP